MNSYMTVRLRISGDFACFTRPENKVERMSYECPTPSASRNILDAICWRPQMRWIVTSISVLKPIRYQSIRRNELQSKLSGGAVKGRIRPTAVTPRREPDDAGRPLGEHAPADIRGVASQKNLLSQYALH